jgi:hypothetical protein
VREERVTIIAKEPESAPRVLVIENTLEGMQKTVRGRIDILRIDERFEIVFNDNFR